ncbi:MAG: hypothetical protein ABIO70_20725 [Pseudomonadota bacterium]
MTDEARIARLRTAYERGRLRDAAPEALLALPVGATLLTLGAPPPHAAVITLLLAAALLGGGLARRSILLGARVGLLGVVGPALSAALMGTSCASFLGLSCAQMCFSLSILVGIGLGAWGGLEAAQRGRWTMLIGLLVTAGIAGSGGCLATGLGHAFGLLLALGAALAPSYAVGRWARQVHAS